MREALLGDSTTARSGNVSALVDICNDVNAVGDEYATAFPAPPRGLCLCGVGYGTPGGTKG